MFCNSHWLLAGGSRSPIRTVASQGWRYHRHGAPGKVLQFEHYRLPFDRSSKNVVVKMLAAPVHRHDKNIIEGTINHSAYMHDSTLPISPLSPTITATTNSDNNNYCYKGSNSGRSSSTSNSANNVDSNGNNKYIYTLPPFPRVAGSEGVGVVEEVGSACELALKEGDMVWINNPTVGTWGTHIVTNEDNLDVVPGHRSDIDLEYFASLSLFHIAYHLTNSFVQLQPNDVVLQTGATSAVAQICQGFIRARGAKLIQTMRLGRNEDSELNYYAKSRGTFAVLPYKYIRTTYMQRLLSDIPPPRLMLDHCGGLYASRLLNHCLGDNGVCISYGNISHKPIQLSNMEFMQKNIKWVGFNIARWWHSPELQTREQRMRVHENVFDGMTLLQGHSTFRAERFKMNQMDSPFAFGMAWGVSGGLAIRKSILRMVGEYGEWRRPSDMIYQGNVMKTLWDDLTDEYLESGIFTDDPRKMKYYTPYNDIFSTLINPKEAREAGFRDKFFRRPNMPRHNTAEESQEELTCYKK